jgi:hypothetical protein
VLPADHPAAVIAGCRGGRTVTVLSATSTGPLAGCAGTPPTELGERLSNTNLRRHSPNSVGGETF